MFSMSHNVWNFAWRRERRIQLTTEILINDSIIFDGGYTQNIHSALYISLQNILLNFCFFLFTQDCTQMKKKNNKKI